MLSVYRIFCTCLLTTSFLLVLGENHIFIHPDATEIRVPFGQIEVFVDSSATLAIHELQESKYQDKFHSGITMAKSPDVAYWLRFRLSGKALKQKSWFLEGRDPNTHYMDFYLPTADGGYQQLSMGLSRPYEERPIQNKNFVLELPNHSETLTVFVRVKTKNKNQFLFRIKSAAYFTYYSLHEYILLGLFYGMMLIMAAYNLLLFIHVKDRLYVWYVGYVLASILICLTEDGLGFQFLWPNFPGFNAFVESLAGILFVIFFIQYADQFIEYSKRLPILNRLIRVVSLLSILGILFHLYSPDLISISLFTSFPTIVVFVAAILVLRQGYTPARLFVMALSFVMMSVLLLFLNKINAFNWIDMSNVQIVLLVYAFNIALVFEVVIFSFAQGQKLLLYQKMQQKILESSELRFRGIFQTSSDAILVYDIVKKRIVNVNDRASDLFGYKRDVFQHIQLKRLFSANNFDKLIPMDGMEPNIQRQASFFCEMKGVRKTGETFDCEMTIAPLHESDRSYFVIVVKDISRRKIAERDLENRIKEIEEKNAMLERYISSNSELQSFAYVASHDLKQPIRTIKGFSQLIQRRLDQYSDSDPDIQEYLDFIISGSSTLESLIHSLLEHSKVNQTGDVEFHQHPLEDIVKLVVINLHEQIQEAEVEMVIRNLPVLHVESSRMIQLFQNIISNAIKFRKKELPCRIVIESKELPDSWQVSIQDNGIGIPPDKQQEVFEIFKKLHRKDDYPGHGIGLATCQKIVAIHGGNIWLESEEGVGTTFFFTIDKHLQPASVDQAAKF